MNEPETSQPPMSDPANPHAPARRRLPRWIATPLGWCWKALRRTGQFLLIGLATLGIYYSNLPVSFARLALALAFAAFAVWAIWITRRPRMRWAFASAFAAVAIWWICIPPSHQRPWRPEVAVMPRAVINGDYVRLVNFRNFVYRGPDDFDVRYQEREVSLAHVTSVDLFVCYWSHGPFAHTFLSFNLDDGSPPVCISIETRLETGETFQAIPALFKQFELIYVVGDERDIVRVRTDHRKEDVYLYRIRASPDAVRRLFRLYLDRINHLADNPEWYHLLKNNCTLNIIRHSRSVGGSHERFNRRYLLNGLIDRYIYSLGIVDTTLSFDDLRQRSHITTTARAAGDAEDFSAKIRASLPVPHTNVIHNDR